MPEKDNIIMTGFMGTGKTTVGRLLARELGYDFVDTDELIMSRFGKSISQIFREKGEAEFRRIEAEVAKELAQKRGLVISTGGRMMLDPANAEALERSGRVFCLIATPEEIVERVTSDDKVERPLLQVDNPIERIVELLQERKEGYNRFAQLVTSDKSPEEVTKNLTGIIRSNLDIRFPIAVENMRYEFMVGGGLLPYTTQLAGIEGTVALITDENVAPLYKNSCGHVDIVIEVPSGQQNKTLSTVQSVCEELVEKGFDRTGTIIALGGSVISGIAGFVAGIYMRGVDLVQCPTSLLAMIDTSIGGKAGINLPQGRNLIGVFKQPKAVIADVATLQSLPPREFISGMAEVIKHALVSDNLDLLGKIESGRWKLEKGELLPPLSTLQALVAQAIQVKINIIQEDPYEKGHRTVLNLGHTFAYAIEHASKHAVTHGEAVAIGIVAATRLSKRLGYCPAMVLERVESLLRYNGLPTRVPGGVTSQQLRNALNKDKKRRKGQLHFVLMRDIGDVFVTNDVSEEALQATLEEITSQCK
ncbi:MAG: 3-dehydroquinate synthase [Spirochaetes bacterium]|nr:MAG: 3-dehydroquinate synthase [Spirochaetota bacterium]